MNRNANSARYALVLSTGLVVALSACDAGLTQEVTARELAVVAGAPSMDCSESAVASVFAGDASVEVTLVKLFHPGEPLALNADDAVLATTVSAELCLIKLNVGPGNPGPAGAPSTSRGIGIEVWLPAADSWTQRIHVVGPAGFAGAPEISSLTQLGTNIDFRGFGEMALHEGAVVSSSDGGHVSQVADASFMTAMADASFGLTPDGKVNVPLQRDMGSRAGHETTLKTKALVQAYYGRPAKFSYFEGCSGGGRQGLKEAQDYPEDFDGIVAGAPAIYALHAALAMLYPQVVMQRDLGYPLTEGQLALVSSAAVSACDYQVTGRHDGYVTDLAGCRYDPTHDVTVLCASDGGINVSPACVTRKEANVVNKFWYGPTVDGSAPSPVTGYASSLRPGQVHFGYTRGTMLAGSLLPVVAGSAMGEPAPIPLATSITAWILEDPAFASPDSWLPAASAKNAWKSLGYADFIELDRRATQLNEHLDDLEASNTDLTQFHARHGKIIQYHGTADTVLPVQGSDMYYDAVAQAQGGYGSVQDFYRYYQVPGFAHCLGAGSYDGRIGISPLADPPLPDAVPDNIFYLELVAWVEGNKAPEEIVVSNLTGSIRRPLCVYPKHLKFSGGDPRDPTRYACQ